MGDSALHSSVPLRAALIVFNASQTRIFVVRGTCIEDAREYAAGNEERVLRRGRPWTHHATLDVEHFAEHAARTARVLADLDATWSFDCVLMAGSVQARSFLPQYLPASIRARLAGSLKVAMNAGEPVVLDTMMAAIARLSARSARAIRHRDASQAAMVESARCLHKQPVLPKSEQAAKSVQAAKAEHVESRVLASV